MAPKAVGADLGFQKLNDDLRSFAAGVLKLKQHRRGGAFGAFFLRQAASLARAIDVESGDCRIEGEADCVEKTVIDAKAQRYARRSRAIERKPPRHRYA